MGLGMKLVEPEKFNGARGLMVIHLVLVLLLPFLFTQMGGCQGEKEVLPMNLGAEVSAEELNDALGKPLAETDPASIQLGEAYVVSETQELGGGAAFAVVSDTSQTVIERQENTAEILLTVIEHKQKYINGEVQKTSTEIPYRIEKSTTATASNISAPAEDSTEGSAKMRPEIEKMLHLRSPLGIANELRARENSTGAKKAESGVSTSETRVTYHGLKVSVAKEPAPPLVQQQPNCLNIPNCQITVHRVSFDMVFWEDGKPDRVHWDLAMSPEVPYLASMLNKCVTGLATLAGDQGNILVKQCLPVVFFRYVQTP
ncbi:hypothetical protein BH10BDE1_BH10BDE1_19370 [soil metagenome]